MNHNIPELTSCYKAFNDCILPRLSPVDKASFGDILNDNFPDVSNDSKQSNNVAPLLQEVMRDHKLTYSDQIVEKN